LKKLATIILLLFLLSTTANAIEMVPETKDFNVIGGGTETYNITFTGTDKEIIVLSYKVLPDGEGVDVSFSDPYFLIDEDEEKIIEVTTAFAINIVPDTYTIQVTAEGLTVPTEVIEVIETETKYIYLDPPQNETNNTLLQMITRLTRERNEYYDQLNDLRDQLENHTPDKIIEKEEVIVKEETTPMWSYITIGTLLVLLITSLVLLKKKQRKNKQN